MASSKSSCSTATGVISTPTVTAVASTSSGTTKMPAVGLGAEQMFVAQVISTIEPSKTKKWLKQTLRCASRYAIIAHKTPLSVRFVFLSHFVSRFELNHFAQTPAGIEPIYQRLCARWSCSSLALIQKR